MYKKQLEEYFAAHQQEMIDDICALMRIPSDRQEPKEGMPFGEGPAKALEKAMEILRQTSETKQIILFSCQKRETL